MIAPHPDDEVLGCGGTIALHSKRNDDMYLCIVTKGYTPDWSEDLLKKRRIEVGNANKILGIKRTFFLDFPTVKIDTIGQKKLNDSIQSVVNEIKPEIVYIPHRGDLNKDHRLIFESSLVAVRPFSGVKKVLSYETLSETEWGLPSEPFVPNVYVDISDTFEFKINAMKTYASEIKRYPHPRSIESIEVLAKKRGVEAGINLAEAFILIRELS